MSYTNRVCFGGFICSPLGAGSVIRIRSSYFLVSLGVTKCVWIECVLSVLRSSLIAWMNVSSLFPHATESMLDRFACVGWVSILDELEYCMILTPRTNSIIIDLLGYALENQLHIHMLGNMAACVACFVLGGHRDKCFFDLSTVYVCVCSMFFFSQNRSQYLSIFYLSNSLST